MKTQPKLVYLACCMVLLGGCAANRTAPEQADQPEQASGEALWKIEPTMNINGRTGDDPAALYQLGRYYQGQNRYAKAIEAYRRAIAADPTHADAYNGLGVVYSRMGRYEDAASAFNSALERAPDAAHIHNNLGYSLYQQGRHSEAVAALEQAVKLDPANPRVHTNLGLAHAGLGDAAAAERAYSDARSTAQQTASGAVAMPEMAPASAPMPAPAPSVMVSEGSPVRVVQLASNVYELQPRPAAPEPPKPVAMAPHDVSKIKLEFANGNGITGFARKTAATFRKLGYPQARLTNQKPFTARTSQVQYRDGYRAAAEQVQSSLPLPAELVQRDDLRADIKIRVLLGRDMAK